MLPSARGWGATIGMPFGPGGMAGGFIGGYTLSEKAQEAIGQGIEGGLDQFSSLAASKAQNPEQAQRLQECVYNTGATALLFLGAKGGKGKVPLKGVRYGPTNLGPLSQAITSTFRGGSYTAITLSEPTTLYRVYGGNAGKIGSYWTRIKPSGPLQSQLDSALVPQWGNTAQKVVSIQVPKGVTLYEGSAAMQSTGVGNIMGGGNQIYIPKVDPSWIKE